MNSKLSVVVPTLNGGDDFKALMKTIREQKDYNDCEVVIIDSGSIDGTLNTARSYNAKIITINQNKFNHGGTRNQGIEQTTGEFVALFTQDALPLGQDFFNKLLSPFNNTDHPGVVGVYARQTPRQNASPLVKRDVTQWLSGVAQPRHCSIKSMNDFLSMSPYQRYSNCVFDNVASVVRREVWQRIPFPHTPFGEDLEWALRVMMAGYEIVYQPEAVVIHSHERPAGYTYKRTLVDHYRLYELFGLQTIPTRKKQLNAFIKSTLVDWRFLFSQRVRYPHWLGECLAVPSNAWASTKGQYDGAKRALQGQRIGQSKSV